MASAIVREKTLKKWHRKYKLNLIERENPQWRDLYEDLLLPRHLLKFDDPWHEEQQ